jgi:hypothetical protein
VLAGQAGVERNLRIDDLGQEPVDDPAHEPDLLPANFPVFSVIGRELDALVETALSQHKEQSMNVFGRLP